MGSVRVINDDNHFQGEMSCSGTKLVVVDYTASWCGPCQRIAPVFEQLARKYPRAVFLKVDVDKCQETAASQGVTAMPTFIFYRNKTKVDRVQGADPTSLENKIQQYYGSEDSDDGESSVQGHMDLSTFIHKQQCECLNESDDHPFAHCLTNNGGYLESDCDEQLIISITFTQAVKVHSLKIKAPQDKGPKTIKLFINQPRTLDFDMADSYQAVQELQLTPEDLEGMPVNLRYVKFQNVQNIQLFIKDNQEGNDTTHIDHITFIGSPISTTNMGEFKRVAGKKGESH
ncbi:thioredoxin-like protein 1 [Zootermopsis nevadensis]|uniref:Thioredoxin-like protein 1 n=1 Tax=Zootermopsis nevadensis TaxID=136037 RepID=A0A067QPC8_ZOONE|nr:thioredoxin-like protein 1 [Zootermopsis nevadensis]XP_021934498.1 thioredoxin-like protein 1 [Zootermopsis nevadensis]XP_021934499.1 thioredoxin-like protein 1 [Zootermopsis nevadensis]KDR11479.1 Thioredoxin-like protein 1 [Zootermopsis nevadensis]